MVEIDESNELAQLALRLGLGEITNGLNFIKERGDSVLVNVMTKEVQFRNAKNTFVRVDDNPMSRETFKYGA